MVSFLMCEFGNIDLMATGCMADIMMMHGVFVMVLVLIRDLYCMLDWK